MPHTSEPRPGSPHTARLGRVALCGRSLPQVGFRDRVALASRAGFGYVSLMGTDLREIVSNDAAAIARSTLDSAGVAVAELDALVGWLPGGTPPAWLSATPDQSTWYRIGEIVGARSINVVDLNDGAPPTVHDAAAAFATVCRRAAKHDLLVSLEFVPWSRIPDLATAAAIVRAADQPNGGVMLDTWHLFRSGGTIADVDALPTAHITGLQINDAPESERNARTQQTEQERLLPGDGVIGIAALLDLLDRKGCATPIGLEVTSTTLAASTPDQVIELLAAAVDAVLPP